MEVIAETAMHHDGDFEFYKELTSSIVIETKTDYVKFHITLDIAEYAHEDHPAYDWLQARIFNETQWEQLFKIVRENGKKLMLLFNDTKAVDFGMKYNPELVEIHSTCLNDITLLNCLNSKINKGTKVVLGVGGSTLFEVENAISHIDSKNVVLMHGFQNYPTDYNDINFNKISKIIDLYPNFEHGYADHTSWENEDNILITLFGAANRMDFIEKHVTTLYGESRVDWQAAISIDMFNKLIEKIDLLKKCNGDGFLKLNSGELSYSTFGLNKKAAVLNRVMSKGEILDKSDFSFKRTSQGSDLSQIDAFNCIGSAIKIDLKLGDCLLKEHFD